MVFEKKQVFRDDAERNKKYSGLQKMGKSYSMDLGRLLILLSPALWAGLLWVHVEKRVPLTKKEISSLEFITPETKYILL